MPEINEPKSNELFPIEGVPLTMEELVGEPLEWSEVEGLGTPENKATRRQIFRQTTAPTTDYQEEDVWYDTDDDNHVYRADAELNWVSVRDGAVIAPGSQNWASDIVFSIADYNTVDWALGDLKDSLGTIYNIAGGSTGNIAADTYIYLDTDVSLTVLQTSTTYSDSVGPNKILLAIASPNADNTKDATLTPYLGAGGNTEKIKDIEDGATDGATVGDNFTGSGTDNNEIDDDGIVTRKIQSTFGNGSDGDVTISANTSLTRDMYYNNLTVDATKILDAAGYRIFVKETLTNNGTIQRTPNTGGNGGAGASGPSSSTGGAAGTGASILADANLAGGIAGVAGGQGGAGITADANGNNGNNGSNGTGIANGVGTDGGDGVDGSDGGDAGVRTGGVGGTGGTGGTVTTKQYPFAFPECVQMLNIVAGASPSQHDSSGDAAGSGGGGSGARVAGSSGYSGAGGGGAGSGSSGGVVVVCARTILNTGDIIAPGGAGGDGGDGADASDTGAPLFNSVNSGGGGGGGSKGGNGGVLTVLYNKLTNSGTIGAPGGDAGAVGTGGAGLLAGVAGDDGVSEAGEDGTLIQLEI
jgi:hypothetical protein